MGMSIPSWLAKKSQVKNAIFFSSFLLFLKNLPNCLLIGDVQVLLHAAGSSLPVFSQ